MLPGALLKRSRRATVASNGAKNPSFGDPKFKKFGPELGCTGQVPDVGWWVQQVEM